MPLVGARTLRYVPSASRGRALALALSVLGSHCSSRVGARDAALADLAAGDLAMDQSPGDLGVDAPPDAGLDADYVASLERVCVFARSGCSGPTVNVSRSSLGLCAALVAAEARGTIFTLGEQVARQCGLTSHDCASFHDCLAHGHAAQCADAGGPRCIGDDFVECSFDPVQAVPCTAFGLRCLTGPTGYGGCSDGTPCVPGDDRCEGTRAVQCDRLTHLTNTMDCATLITGGTCLLTQSAGDAGLSARCAVRDEPCRGTEPECQGDTLYVCEESTGIRRWQECGLTSGRCDATPGATACAPPVGSDCDVYTDTDVCEGTVIRTCIAGIFSRFDCRSAGYRTCTVGDAGQPVCTQ